MIMIIDNEFDDIFQNPPVNTESIPQKADVEDDIFNNLTTSEPTNNIVIDLLRSRGIEDPSKIIVIDENEQEIEVDFNTLSREEQLQIINGSDNDEPIVTQSEIDKILTENNLTLDEFLELYKQQVLEENNISAPQQSYSVDNYTDQELFMLDLKNKYEDLTDEELEIELNKELTNETLFKKKIDKIRSDYKVSEDAYKEQQQLEFEQENQRKYDEFSDTMLNIAMDTPELYDIELEDEEKNATLAFLLDLDDSGSTEFSKTLNDPKRLYEVAWFLKYGKDAFDAIKSHYESEITRLKSDLKKTKVIIKPEQKKESLF